ncbi:MAG: hypothetical protein QOD10_4652, partial [Mycobacterium sp.]|nr:hypothetical protein [Mycobacterium sp.]
MVGVVLAALLIGALGFVGLRLTRGHEGAPAPTTAQSSPPTSFAVPGCYNPSVPPVERPK